MKPSVAKLGRMTGHAPLTPRPRRRPIAAAGFRAHVRLSDGQRLTLRPVRASDKLLLVDLMGRLSEGSRFRRFLTAKSRLTEEELTYLTDVDGVNHVALLALDDDGVVLGVGRIVQDPAVAGTAEAALVIDDAVQGRGLGTQLMATLIAAARERDIDRLHIETHVDNTPMRRLAERHRAIVINMSQGVAHFVIDLGAELRASHH